MKINDELLKYLSGNLNPAEKSRIEEKISRDPDLQSELESYRKNLSNLKSLADVEADTAYFNNLPPKVREKIEKKRRPALNRKIAFALSVIVILGIIFYNRYFNIPVEKPNDISTIIARMDDSSKAELLTGDYDQYNLGDSVTVKNSTRNLTEELSKIILQTSTSKPVSIENDIPIDTYDLVDDLSSEEADIVYKDLINKKIM